MQPRIVLLGSNIDPQRHIVAAIEEVAARWRVLAASRVYRSRALDPHGRPSGQDDFLNAALLVETHGSDRELQEVLRGIEARLGRVRTGDRYAARTIDLDIVGHADLERPFAQAPVHDIAPDLVPQRPAGVLPVPALDDAVAQAAGRPPGAR